MTLNTDSKTHIHLPTFFFNDTATTEIYTLSLHDALPISRFRLRSREIDSRFDHSTNAVKSSIAPVASPVRARASPDRQSTRLNSSHSQISYAVFCSYQNISRHYRPQHNCIH